MTDRHLDRESRSPVAQGSTALEPPDDATKQRTGLRHSGLSSVVSGSDPAAISCADWEGPGLLSPLALFVQLKNGDRKTPTSQGCYYMLDFKCVKNTENRFRFYYFLANCVIMGLRFPICKIKTPDQIMSKEGTASSVVPAMDNGARWQLLTRIGEFLRDTKPIFLRRLCRLPCSGHRFAL